MPYNKGRMTNSQGDLTGIKATFPSKAAASKSRPRRGIDLLFGSAVRVDVLWVFLRYPDKGFMAADLARLTGWDLKAIRRALSLMSDNLGLTESFHALSGVGALGSDGTFSLPDPKEIKSQGRRFYHLNEHHPWVPALRMLLESAIGALHVLREGLKKLEGIDVAFVFGSFATGEQRPGSDVDLVVIGQQTLMSIAKPISEVENKIGRSIGVITMQPQEWRQRWEEKNHFVQSLIYDPKVFLIEDDERLEQITAGPRSEARETI